MIHQFFQLPPLIHVAQGVCGHLCTRTVAWKYRSALPSLSCYGSCSGTARTSPSLALQQSSYSETSVVALVSCTTHRALLSTTLRRMWSATKVSKLHRHCFIPHVLSGSREVPSLLTLPRVRFVYLPAPPTFIAKLPRRLFLLFAPLKVAFQLLTIVSALFYRIERPPEFILVQVRLLVLSTPCSDSGVSERTHQVSLPSHWCGS